MKKIKVIITFLVLGLLMTPTFALAQNDGIKLGGNPLNFDKGKYEAAINQAFLGNVMGYQVILLKNGQIVSKLANGYARNMADGNIKMTLNTPANIGSTAKFFAGTALLQLFERPKNRYSNPRGLSIDGWLDEKIYFYMPKVWKDNIHESIKQITFRDLLEHRGGFIQNDNRVKMNFDYLKLGVSNDKTQDFAHGKRNYANANITFVGYLLAGIAKPHLIPTLDLEVAKKKLAPDDPYIQNYLGDEFETYVKEKMFGKISPAIYPSCSAPSEYSQKNIAYAKIYKIASDISKGAESDSKKKNGACHAAGGWYISGMELAAYVANFAATEKIVSAKMREKMYDDDDSDNRLLWSMTQSDTLMKQKLQWQTSPYMGGDWGGAHATIIQLPNDYYAVGIINSSITPTKKGDDFGGSWELTGRIINSFNAGITDSF
jgi:Beta-lactamase